uniref:NADH-ubiquinone oxidoreductase chain 4 n=1 Tax=Geukensia demissa TaxID=27807 RepID=A0A6B9VNQ0_GEUDE|nr:NADH dehydrogenase subunit 4 [Geukensia demissa]QHO63846.1 NADH dehydrogenase subunit 4 [Geukensia demissa]UJM44214.1 NADH dehydrogenase subunit 4 [Geukensia demissa]
MIFSLLFMLLYLMVMLKLNYVLVGLIVLLFMSMMMLLQSNGGMEMMGLFWCDLLSGSLICLTFIILILMVMMSFNVVRKKLFSYLINFMGLVLICTFTVMNFFFFFFFFESVLVPVLILILVWGYQPERLQAGSYMVIYTSMGSFPFLFGISSMVYEGMSDSMFSMMSMSSKFFCDFYFFYILGFLVKLPMFPFHLWLPKAHVEAPVSGSMILAGVLLKLGGYGMIRLLSLINFSMNGFVFSLFLGTGLMGGVYTSLMCIRQVDLKSLIAYSSVGHMSLVVLGLLSMNIVGYYGAIILMLGHGLCSSGLFSIVSMLYNSSNSRSVFLNKGVLLVCPWLSTFCFLLSIGNMAAPPTLNFLGEVILFMSSMKLSWILGVLLAMMSFLSACYSLFFYGVVCHGKNVGVKINSVNCNFIDCLVCFLHWFPLNLLFFFM